MKKAYADDILSVLDYESFSFFRDNKKIKTSSVQNRGQYAKVLRTIFKKAKENLLENEGGVVLDKLGYIGIIRYPYRQLIKKPFLHINGKIKAQQLLYNLHTDRYSYLLGFFTDAHKLNRLGKWSMDYTFRDDLKRGLAKKLKEGKRYKLYYTLVKGLLKRK